MRIVSASFLAAIFGGVLFASHAPTARALTILCDGEVLSAEDRENAQREAELVAGGRTLDWAGAYICTHENSAELLLEAPAEPRPDGTHVYVSVSCERQTGPWKCEIRFNRSIKMKVGSGRDYVWMALPMELDVEPAQSLMRQVVELAPTLNATHDCSYDPTAARVPQADSMERTLRESFSIRRDDTDSEGGMFAHIRMDGDLVEVESESSILRFERNPKSASGFDFQCWDGEILLL